jgi:BirA family transcriptional regulator, biotin operon repressor / biotin---[acetyl-CoA-carboxylase] ligase
LIAKIAPNTQLIGQNIFYFDIIDSTNNFAQELIKENKAINGTVIFSEEQTHGKGQRLKNWFSEPNKNLTFSIILFHDNNLLKSPFILNKLFTVSLYQVLEVCLPNQSIEIKWPNDILVNGKKICGILIENNFSGSKINYSVIGIGLNVNQKQENEYATSIIDILLEEQLRPYIFEQLIEKIDHNYQDFLSNGAEYFEELFNQHLKGFNQTSQFIINEELTHGKIIGCDKDGQLQIIINQQTFLFQHGTIKQLINE